MFIVLLLKQTIGLAAKKYNYFSLVKVHRGLRHLDGLRNWYIVERFFHSGGKTRSTFENESPVVYHEIHKLHIRKTCPRNEYRLVPTFI